MRKIVSALIAVVAVLDLSGCAGPKFSPVASVPSQKALVYIYRKSALGGIAGNHHIFVNGQPVTSLYSGSYFPYYATPGTNFLSSKLLSLSVMLNMVMNAEFKDRICRLDAEPGHTYYVQFHIADTWGPKMKIVDPAIGERDIQNCHLAKAIH